MFGQSQQHGSFVRTKEFIGCIKHREIIKLVWYSRIEHDWCNGDFMCMTIDN